MPSSTYDAALIQLYPKINEHMHANMGDMTEGLFPMTVL
jgi:hypothetical protein